MSELLQTYWPAIVAALVFGVVLAWYLFHASRKTNVTGTSRDVLNDGAERAGRNEALIALNAPEPQPDPVVPPATPVGMAGAGEAVSGASEAAQAASDDLTCIKGLGPKLQQQLNGLGVTSLSQIAAWDDEQIDRIDSQLGRFQGRIRRDDWVGQAQLLSAGKSDEFSERYGANS